MFEYLCEMMIQNGCQYFDLHDLTRVTFSVQWQRDTDDFTGIVCNSEDADAIDSEVISKKVELTANTMFHKHRYKIIELKR